jgi:hypothetical protein
MVLYYAMGGGLGHLVRARAVLHTLGLAHQASILSASPHARDRRVVAELPVFAPPEPVSLDAAATSAWAVETITRLGPRELWVDAFPAGLLGELRRLRVPPPTTYVARLLQWHRYEPLARDLPLRFARALIIEDLHPEHAAFTASTADRVERLEIIDPPVDPPLDPAALSAPLPDLPARFTLVVHTGDDGEIAELVAYARELARREDDPSDAGAAAIVVCRPGATAPSPPGTVTVDLHPATPLFARATRIVTACGFNVMRQLTPFARKHRFLPLPRRYDDQYTRASRARAARAASQADAPPR